MKDRFLKKCFWCFIIVIIIIIIIIIIIYWLIYWLIYLFFPQKYSLK